MKIKLSLVVLSLFLSFIHCISQDNLWKDVDKNIEDKLPQSAEISLNKIEQRAIKNNDQKELLKTFLYRFKIFALQDENPIETSIAYAEENISRLQEPERAVFSIAIASLYESYMKENKHIIRTNIPIVDAQKQNVNIHFWDEATFKRVINQYYEAALSDIESLQNNTTKSYSDIFTVNDKNLLMENDIEPTLYDYVAHKVINHRLNEQSNQEVIDLYDDLISFDKSRNYGDAVIYNEIYKLKYEYKISGDFDLYFNTLEKNKKENIDNPLVTSVMALQAQAVLNQYDNEMMGQQKTLEICDEAIKLFPNTMGAMQCESMRSEILRKELSLSMQSVLLTNKDIAVDISYRNLTNIHYRIYKLSQKEVEELATKSEHDKVEALLKKRYIIENVIELPEVNDFKKHSTSILLPKLGYGTYYIMSSKDGKFSIEDEKLPAIHDFQVSNLSYVTTKENNDFVIYVLDRESGKPIKDVNVNIYKQTYDYKLRKYNNINIADLTTDKKGIVRITNLEDNSFYVNLYKDDDQLLSSTSFSNHQNNGEGKLREKTTFFTDRAIYRPGQTVYFKGIMINQNSTTKELLVGKTTKVTFRNSNWQEVAAQTLTTNEYGSFDGSFVIPNNVSNGYFSIKNESGNISFKVEEYKRPTFEITFDNIDKSFKLNEEVDLKVSVKAYSGFALDNIDYDYTIVRRCYFPYRFWWNRNYDNNEKQIAFGEGKTDDKGNLTINFKLLPDEEEKDKLPVFEYLVTVNATNAQGETQTKTYTLKASEIDVVIDIENDNEIVDYKNLDKIDFAVKNLKENPVKAKIIRKIYQVNEKVKSSHDVSETTKIYEDEILVDGRYGLFQNVNEDLDCGRYVVELISADNEKAMTSIDLTIIDFNAKKMPYDTMCISYNDKESAQPRENVNFYLGSSAKDVSVYVMIKHGDEVRYSRRETISNEILKVSYKVKEEDRGNITFQAFFVKNNTINIVQHNVVIPYDNYKLDIRLDVERDVLLPGSEEKWNLTVKNFTSDAVVANVMASMYDASLDVFAKNRWSFNTMPQMKYSTKIQGDDGFGRFTVSAENQYFKKYLLFDYNLLSKLSLTPFVGYYRYGSVPEEEVRSMKLTSFNKVSNAEMNLDDSYEEESIEASGEDVTSQDVDNSIRENFNETAFFYPNMITNADGSLTFSFTMPDALTRWNLMMLAYTKDLKVGTLNKTFTSSKPLMIMSDMPRFCYENDTLWIVANVIRTASQQDKEARSKDVETAASNIQKPKTKLEIFDALTMQPLDLILSEQDINLDEIPEGGSKSVRWKVAFEKDMNLLALRFSVTTDDFSDAEQHLLPILSDEVFMTETYPLTVEAKSEKTFEFDFNEAGERNQSLTLNFYSDPVWYAIQALPYLSQETGEHADVAFNIFYVNSLASYIAHNIPNLLNYIKKWEIETPDALMSQLHKDESLKAIMLEETPWVLEAKSEVEQRSRIVNLFDINTLKYKTDESLNLLKEKQSVNGGWSWLPNMPESSFITQYILKGIGRLYKTNVVESLSANHQRMVKMISERAIDYLSDDVINDYEDVKNLKTYYLSNYSVVNELYALSFFDFDESSKYVKAKVFFVNRLEKDWRDLDFETQAKAALILHREGKNDAASLIMQSLKERMTQLTSSTDVSEQAMIMEAFREINPDTEILNKMMIGLLNNKRTNMWENAMSSVDAIYAIWVSTSRQDMTAQESMTQRYWNAAEMRDFTDFTLENTTDNIAWGGLFRQYFVSIDEVKKHESLLNVERELFVERINDAGTYLVPIDDADIKVGDKVVVNLIVESSQDMEFVFLKDLRAACLEPMEQMSRYKYFDGMCYYQSNSDTYMGFYFDNIKKGQHKFTYSMYVTKEGSFSNGYALIQCLYAPEFSAYSDGMRIEVGR